MAERKGLQHIDYGYNGAVPLTPDGLPASYRLKDRGASTVLQDRVHAPLADLRAGTRVVNLGCGDGNFEANIPLGRRYSMVSIDQDPSAVASVKDIFEKRRNGNGHHDIALVGDVTRLVDVVSLPIGSVDAAVAWRVVHALPDALHEPVFNQVSQVLRPGGSFYLAVLSDEDWKREELEAAGQYKPNQVNECLDVMRFDKAGIPKDSWPLYFFSEEKILELGEKAGLVPQGEVVSFREATGFAHLAQDPDRSDVTYRFVEFQKPENINGSADLPFPAQEFHGMRHN